MKKTLLFVATLLITPIIAHSQLLHLPVSDIIVEQGYGLEQVPPGKAWQWVGMSTFQSSDVNNYSLIYWQSHFGGYVEKYHIFREGQDLTVNWGENNFDCQDCYFTFIEFDLDAQGLAYNTPQDSKPTLYPNPTSSLLALNSNKEYNIEVYDMAGNKLMSLTGNAIDMSHLSSATYIVKALDKSVNKAVSYKVIKK